MNTDKLDEILIQYLIKPDISKTEAIPVIITMNEVSENLDFLKEKGVQIKHIYQSINAVAGKATAPNISTLSDLPSVSKIEYDGEVTYFTEE